MVRRPALVMIYLFAFPVDRLATAPNRRTWVLYDGSIPGARPSIAHGGNGPADSIVDPVRWRAFRAKVAALASEAPGRKSPWVVRLLARSTVIKPVTAPPSDERLEARRDGRVVGVEPDDMPVPSRDAVPTRAAHSRAEQVYAEGSIGKSPSRCSPEHLVIQPRAAAPFPEHLRLATRFKDPLVKLTGVVTERRFEPLVRTSPVAIDRDAEVVHAQSGHVPDSSGSGTLACPAPDANRQLDNDSTQYYGAWYHVLARRIP